MNEAETHAELIALERLRGGGKRSKAEIADYVLVYRKHKLAVIEAKKRDTPLGKGVGQTKAYAQKLAVRFTYSTNGLAIYGIDMQSAWEGDVTIPDPGGIVESHVRS